MKQKRIILEYTDYTAQVTNRLFPYTWTGNPTDAIKAKFLDLKDMSRSQEYVKSDFANTVDNIKLCFRIGEKVKAIRMNAPFKEGYDASDFEFGNLKEIRVNWTNEEIRIFLVKPSTLSVFEVYPETIEKYNKTFETKSYVKSYSQFIKG